MTSTSLFPCTVLPSVAFPRSLLGIIKWKEWRMRDPFWEEWTTEEGGTIDSFDKWKFRRCFSLQFAKTKQCHDQVPLYTEKRQENGYHSIHASNSQRSVGNAEGRSPRHCKISLGDSQGQVRLNVVKNFVSVTPSMGILFPLLRKIKVSTLWSSFFFEFHVFCKLYLGYSELLG
jgi:hypothetical protein